MNVSVNHMLKSILPDFVTSSVKSIKKNRDLKKLNSLDKMDCITDNLMSEDLVSVAEIFNSQEIDNLWKQSKAEMDVFKIPDGTGGVNPGDRRAVYYLISKFKPKSILEIGTHIGASTIHIASAIKANGLKTTLTTLDIRDVNSTSNRPWEDFGSKYSPAEMIEKLGCGAFVNFITDTSVGYFKKSHQKFDFIFLDGDHAGTTVYQEIPLALKLLNSNGVILLHDYCPNGQRLWSSETPIFGPYAAVERLKDEGADLVVIPLGDLPWPTKLNSNVTSLALLMKKKK